MSKILDRPMTATQAATLAEMYAARVDGDQKRGRTVNRGEMPSRKVNHKVIEGLQMRGLVRVAEHFPSGDALFALTSRGRMFARAQAHGIVL